jgi:hypothetical protein
MAAPSVSKKCVGHHRLDPNERTTLSSAFVEDIGIDEAPTSQAAGLQAKRDRAMLSRRASKSPEARNQPREADPSLVKSASKKAKPRGK